MENLVKCESKDEEEKGKIKNKKYGFCWFAQLVIKAKIATF